MIGYFDVSKHMKTIPEKSDFFFFLLLYIQCSILNLQMSLKWENGIIDLLLQDFGFQFKDI